MTKYSTVEHLGRLVSAIRIGNFYTKKGELIYIKRRIRSYTFSRKTRNGCWNAFKLLLIEEGCIWTSLLPSYQTVRSVFTELEDCLRLLRTVATMPWSLAATLGYRPAHRIACKGNLKNLQRINNKWNNISTGKSQYNL